MKKTTLLKTIDVLIIIPIALQFIIFLLSYETELLATIFAIAQFIMLLIYVINAVKLRAHFETIVNQENVFFDHQFDEIKDKFQLLSYSISEYFDRQRDIAHLRHPFQFSKIYYQKKILIENGHQLSIDLLMLTEKGIFLVDFYEARFVLKGDYQADKIQLQYSKNNQLDILNPLSKIRPIYQALVRLLSIEDEHLIKRLLIVENECLIANMNTLDENQEISKEVDIPKKIRQLKDASQHELSKEVLEEYIAIIDEKIIG